MKIVRTGTVELELDDVIYIGEYTYTRPRPETRWERAEGGVYFDELILVLEGYEGPLQVDITSLIDRLTVMDRLYQKAHEQQREIA